MIDSGDRAKQANARMKFMLEFRLFMSDLQARCEELCLKKYDRLAKRVNSDFDPTFYEKKFDKIYKQYERLIGLNAKAVMYGD